MSKHREPYFAVVPDVLGGYRVHVDSERLWIPPEFVEALITCLQRWEQVRVQAVSDSNKITPENTEAGG